MKLIHCADIHLDSKLETNLDREKAALRRGELLNTFVKMVDYAEENDVEAILISGDLFDKNRISLSTVKTVRNTITSHPHIRFYYLKGNHDSGNVLGENDPAPENLMLFGETWKTYEEPGGRIRITGAELSEENSGKLYSSLSLENDCLNIVMLHGQAVKSSSGSGKKGEIINLRSLMNKGIDYLALGHVHSPSAQKLDERGVYVYPGCLEGRGFDECGEHGFFLLDTDNEQDSFSYEFISFSGRRFFEIYADIGKCTDSSDIIRVIKAETEKAGCMSSDMLKIVLTGHPGLNCEKDCDYITSVFADRYFLVRLYDETSPFIDAESFRLDSSLKGEFVRTVLEDPDISESDRPYVIQYGLSAIMGDKKV